MNNISVEPVMTRICFAAQTHRGVVRDHNEDSIYGSLKNGLWVVADGMGGHACGEIASQIVVQEMQYWIPRGKSLSQAIELSHRAVNQKAQSNNRAKGMGSTLVSMLLTGKSYEIAWVGDSRAYRLRQNRLELLTRDHSYIEWLKDNGIAIEDIRNHPKRNVITQSIGIGQPLPEMISGQYAAGDRYLLCSDGLNDELTDAEIETILTSPKNTTEVAQMLIAAALAKEGKDNISVIIIDINAHSRSSILFSNKLARQPWLPMITGAVAAIIAVSLIKLLQ